MTTPSAEARRQQKLKEAESLDARSIHEIIRREGERELGRATGALFWSGLGGGLSMGFSFVGVALLHAHLPDAEWRPLLTALGYTLGFLIVILGSQQLFTENTLTPVVPLLARWSGPRALNLLRLWAVVLAANLLGGLLFALALAGLDVLEPKVVHALSTVSAEALQHGFAGTLRRGLYAGWLIALLVWMLPGAEPGRIPVIVVMTYVVGAAGLSHVIVGASEAFYAALTGAASWHHATIGFLVPALIGNVIGGVTMVAALNHLQATAGQVGGQAEG